MFNSIRGIITEKHTDAVFILSGGIEWDITVPATDIARLPPAGSEGRVFTWLYHRGDDSMRLFGFSDDKRRLTFLELLKVEGIGPKGAIRIMGGIGQEELELALEKEDLSRLEAVPGLGKKTAQKMILALKGRLIRIVEPPRTSYGELAEALIGMGYERKAAIEALGKAEVALEPGIPEAEREKQLFKQAIRYLSSGL
ncbi:MAG: Holliday junction branch migration protein RuvA [Spirochaetaceae bacterium]|jgi:Holliday junction DNA helicase RuvA|nr:Holliday junction branch migration protein RuvA [Spirochaetaceae bacterium]